MGVALYRTGGVQTFSEIFPIWAAPLVALLSRLEIIQKL